MVRGFFPAHELAETPPHPLATLAASPRERGEAKAVLRRTAVRNSGWKR
jgi:hypothetical protein